jgi:8-oxo-dGTP pyrophosphatase MutT (NUDIX family)
MEREVGMIESIADFAPDNAETGVGLALQDDQGRYLFMLAGARHHCSPGELFYAGIGGHREEGEGWLTCARREAHEEISTEIEILPASVTWYIPRNASVMPLEVLDRPRPLAFYEMINPPGAPREGELYHIVIYRARLCGLPTDLLLDEVRGVIALTAGQVRQGPNHKPMLSELIDEGAEIVVSCETINPQVRLYPLGTAMALAHVLRHVRVDANG